MRYYKQVCLLVMIMPAASFGLFAQGIAPVGLQQQPAAVTPKAIYISEVTDSLANGPAIGKATDKGKSQKLTMQGGVAAAIKNFTDQNINQDRSKQAATLNVAKIDIGIKKKGTEWVVDAAMSVKFYVGGLFLKMYSNSAHGEMDTPPGAYAGEFISTTIIQDIGEFDKWWAEHKNEFAVSQTVKVNVTIGKTVSIPDCIVYSIGRPLAVSDFKGAIQHDTDKHAATYSGMAYASATETKNGQLVINYTITPYFEKTRSWFNGIAGSPVLLAHEQAHFDITAIKACELATAIRNATLTKAGYQATIDRLKQQYNDALNDEQATYDKETNHSKIADKQQEWQQKIAKQVRETGCY